MPARFPSALSWLALVTLAAVAGPMPVHAADASRWAGDNHAQVRLIAGSNPVGAPALRAGLDIKLAPGWKTYWRYPGDSGVPPRFDFAASRNVRTVDVAWPAPRRMADAGGQVIGYHDRVIMPLRVVPADPAKPVLLRLKLSYAICEKLCVPAEAAAELDLAARPSTQEADLAAAEARVPRPARVGDSGVPAIRAVRREDGGTRPRVIVEIAAPRDAPVDLFVEGPTPEWALPLPEPKESAASGSRQFTFELDGVPSGAQAKGAELTFTLVAGATAIEAKTRLD